MDNTFSFDFDSLLKKVQPKPIRIFLQILISFAIFTVAEITFFSNFRTMVVTECSLPNNSTSMSLDNCFSNNNTVTTCLNNQYSTGSNYSLSIVVPLKGLNDDKYSQLVLGICILTFSAYMIVYQVSHYFSFQKGIRIQNILRHSKILVDGKKKYEGRITLYFFFMAACYVAAKVTWIAYRDNQYSTLECDGQSYKIQFQATVTSSIGTLIQAGLGLIIMPLIYIGTWINYLSNVDLMNILKSLSNDTLKQFKNIRVLDINKYNQVIDKEIEEKYKKENFISRFQRKNTFSFWKTKDEEITEILLKYQKECPDQFDTILYNEPKISIKSSQYDDDNQKLIN